MKDLKKYRLQIAGSFAGAVAGFLYYKFVGCASGTCIITSHPINSALYGAFLFWLVAGMVKDAVVRTKKATQINNNKIQ
jgi:phage shock protein E